MWELFVKEKLLISGRCMKKEAAYISELTWTHLFGMVLKVLTVEEIILSTEFSTSALSTHWKWKVDVIVIV